MTATGIERDQQAAFQRSIVYELLSHVFADPSATFAEFAANGELRTHLMSALALLESQAGAMGEHDTMLYIDEAAGWLKEEGVEALYRAYTGITSPEVNFLYECNYQERFSAFEEMADIAGFYRAFGMDIKNDRPDVLTAELEFMRILAMKEARALMDGEEEHLEVCISAQKEFLLNHLGRWARIFSTLIQDTPFYGPMSSFLHHWIKAECTVMSLNPLEIDYAHCMKAEEDETVSGDCALCVSGNNINPPSDF